MKWMFLDRYYQDETGTFGKIEIKDHYHPPIFTLELPWKSNTKNISCIPMGTYDCVPHNSARFKNIYRLLDVPGRSGILIHIGNYLKEIEGCILPGRGVDTQKYNTIHSTIAMNIIRGIMGGEDFKLKIIE